MKKKKCVLIVLLVLALLLGGLGYWQRNNIDALLMSRRMSQDELSDKITEQQEKTVDIFREAGVDVRSLTDEEREAIRNSEIPREELIERISGKQTGEQSASETPTPSQGADVTESAQQAEQDNTAALRDQLAKYVAEIYVMEAEYTTWLEQANQSAIDEFVALPEAEQTSSTKFNIGMKYLAMAKDKEKECDAKMADLEAKIRAVLTQLGEPTKLADDIHSSYLEEKAAKKAYYLGLH